MYACILYIVSHVHVYLGRQERDYETAVDVLETTIAKLRQEKSQLDERTAVLEQQLQYRQDSAREREKEMESLRKQVIQLSVSSDQSLAIGQLQQQLTASQVNYCGLWIGGRLVHQ